MESDAGRGSCDLYWLCGSGVFLLVRQLLFIPNWLGGCWGRQGNWHPSCGICPFANGGASTSSVRAEPSRMATFFWVRGKHLHTSSETSTSSSCSFMAWDLLGWEPKLGTREERKDLFLRSHLSHVVALVSISNPVS